jgi:hypothetical protein
LLILAFVTTATIPRRHLRCDRKSVVFLALLIRCGLMAVEARHALFSVAAHFVFMHDRILLAQVTFGAFSSGPYERRVWLISFDCRTPPIDHEGSDNQRKSDYDCDEDRAKRHLSKPPRHELSVEL